MWEVKHRKWNKQAEGSKLACAALSFLILYWFSIFELLIGLSYVLMLGGFDALFWQVYVIKWMCHTPGENSNYGCNIPQGPPNHSTSESWIMNYKSQIISIKPFLNSPLMTSMTSNALYDSWIMSHKSWVMQVMNTPLVLPCFEFPVSLPSSLRAF